RLRSPSLATRSRGNGEAAVQRMTWVGSWARSGRIRARRPATAQARNVAPPKKVPAAAPGRPLALAAIPAAMFSTSSSETSTVRANVDHRSRPADATRPERNNSAPPTISAKAGEEEEQSRKLHATY